VSVQKEDGTDPSKTEEAQLKSKQLM
jgi:hypothetical protein